MQRLASWRGDAQKAASIIQAAGGTVVGRTRLQKLAYLLEITGLGSGFPFEYRHYGPYSEELAKATSLAALYGLISEEEHPATWGGSYSVYRASAPNQSMTEDRDQLVKAALSANPIDLELAATAAFLAKEGHSDPWGETSRRKVEKSTRIPSAKNLYATLMKINTPRSLPHL